MKHKRPYVLACVLVALLGVVVENEWLTEVYFIRCVFPRAREEEKHLNALMSERGLFPRLSFAASYRKTSENWPISFWWCGKRNTFGRTVNVRRRVVLRLTGVVKNRAEVRYLKSVVAGSLSAFEIEWNVEEEQGQVPK